MGNKVVVFSIGPHCRPAHYLKEFELRKQAFPMDWQMCSLEDSIKLYENRFKDFFKEYKNYPEKENKQKGLRCVEDTKNKVVSIHHISNNVPLDEAVTEFRKLMLKRYHALDNTIKKSDLIIMVGSYNVSKARLDDFLLRFSKMYKDKEMILFNVHNRKNGAHFHERIVKKNLKIVEFFFNDVHKNGSDPAINPKYWHGNVEKWDEMMEFLIKTIKNTSNNK